MSRGSAITQRSHPSSTKVLKQRFRILDTYRGGGAVEVYKAAALDDDEFLCALTVLHPNDARELANMPHTFGPLAQVKQPNLPEILEFGWLAGASFVPVSESPKAPEGARFYYVRSWVDGAILRNHIDNQERKRLSINEALNIIEALAVGTRALHANGILHLNITPANVMIPLDRTPVRLIGLESCWSMAQPFPGIGSRGTPGYSAPELFVEGATGYQVSYPSDVFSLAVLLFEMISGRTPFGTGLEYLGYWSELTRRARPFSLPMQFEGNWGDGLLAAHLHWCLEGMSKRRPNTVDEFLAGIRLLKRALPLSALGGSGA